MTYPIVIAALLLLSGCYQVPGETPVMSSHPAETRAALEQWAQDYTLGSCSIADVTVVYADPGLMAELCGDNAAELWGCSLRAGYPRHYVIAIEADTEGTPQAVVTVTHELMHVLSRCSDTWPDYQAAHDDPTIWGKGGILERTEKELEL